jgi:hypothetical protein
VAAVGAGVGGSADPGREVTGGADVTAGDPLIGSAGVAGAELSGAELVGPADTGALVSSVLAAVDGCAPALL